MARDIGVTFTLNGALGSGFRSAFRGAAGQIQGITEAIREMERQPIGKIGAAMDAQKAKLRDLGSRYRLATGELQSLQARATAAGGAHGVLARQIAQAQTQVQRLSGQLAMNVARYHETVAQATTAAGSVRNLSTAYQQLSASMERARAQQARLVALQSQQQAIKGQRAELTGQLMSTAAAGMVMAAPVKLAVGFEDAMARVGALANAGKDQLAQLTATARQLGRDTQYSASQAAEGMQYLAMAGFNTNQTIAAMPGLLNMAAAGNTDLGRTADIASNILTQFGLSATKMGDVADILVNTFTSSNTTLETLGDTMKYVGPVAASLGLSLEDTAACAGMLGSAGIQASQAGTAMRAAFLRLAAPPKMAKDALGELAGVAGPELDELYEQIGDNSGALDALQEIGMTTKDAQGNMRPFADILQEIMIRTQDMGNSDRAAAFKKIFGTEASAAMIKLAEESAKTVNNEGEKIVDSTGKQTTALLAYMEKIKNYHGTSSRVAKQMNDTTGGELRRLKSAWEDVGIQVGNMFLPAIRAAAVALTTVANGISSFTSEFPLLSQGLALACGGLLALKVAMVAGRIATLVFRSSLLDLQKGMIVAGTVARVAGGGMLTLGRAFAQSAVMARVAALGIKGALIGTGIGAAVVMLGMAAQFLIEHWDGVKTFFAELGPAIWERLSPFVQGIVGLWEGAANWITGIWTTVSDFFGGLWGGIADMANSVCQLVSGAWQAVASGIGEAFSGVSSVFSGTFGFAVEAATWAWGSISSVWSGVAGFFGGIADSIRATFDSVFNWLAGKFEWVSSVIGWIKGAAGAILGGTEAAPEKAKAADSGQTAGATSPTATGQLAATPAAAPAVPPATGGATPANRPATHSFTPVSRKEVLAANPEPEKPGKKKKSGGSGSGKKKAGSGAGGSDRVGSGAGTGTTIVKLAGDNTSFTTQYIPAGGSGPSLSAASGVMGGTGTPARILPFDAAAIARDPASVLPSMAKNAPFEVGRMRMPKGANAARAAAAAPTSVQVNLNQDFKVATQGMVDEIRRKLVAAGPEFEALVRRALGDIQAQSRRVAYAQ